MSKQKEWVEQPGALNKRDMIIRQIVFNAILIIVCLIVLYPVLWVIMMAITPNEIAGVSSSLIPQQVTFDNFIDVVSRVDDYGNHLFLHQLKNSVLVAAITTALGVLLACTAAYGFSRLNFVGRQLGLQAFLVTQMFPGVVMTIPLYILLGKLGLLNSIVGLVLVYSVSALPFCVWNLKGYFDTIPKELEEAAIVANPYIRHHRLATRSTRHRHHRPVQLHDRMERIHFGGDTHEQRACLYAPCRSKTVRRCAIGPIRSVCRWRHHRFCPHYGAVLCPTKTPRRWSHRWRR